MSSVDHVPGETKVTGDGRQDRPRRRFSGQTLEAMALPIAWLVIIVIFGILRPDTFLTSANLSSILASQSVVGLGCPGFQKWLLPELSQ